MPTEYEQNIITRSDKIIAELGCSDVFEALEKLEAKEE